MYTPRPQAPPAFMKRYDAIMKGKERLDTVDKLKDFWLFAIAQGWESYEGREWVALLTEEADWKSPVAYYFMGRNWGRDKGSPSIKSVHDCFRGFKSMDRSPYPDEQTDEEYLDDIWRGIEVIVKAFNPDDYKDIKISNEK